MKKNWALKFSMVCVILSLMLVVSCGKKKVETGDNSAKVETPAAKDAAPAATAAPVDTAAKVATDEGAAKEAGLEKSGKEAVKEATENDDNVYFDFDSSVIPDSQTTALEKEAEWLKANANVKITVEGHCDERGTEEYNIALGDRRAVSAKKFLEKLGIGADRMKTVSYGKEKPLAVGHNEEAWAKNRRAHFDNK
jgi:peptidoglycan-associated lipoprotein